jgi:hydroxypyruvate reductase
MRAVGRSVRAGRSAIHALALAPTGDPRDRSPGKRRIAGRDFGETMTEINEDHRVEIALLGAMPAPLHAALEERYVVHPLYSDSRPFAELALEASNCRGAVGSGMAGLRRAHIEAMPKLEICALHGVGLETSDLADIKEQGIVLATAPVLFDDVADLAIALALGCCRQIVRADGFVRSGAWSRRRLELGRKLTGMRAGIFGLGRIGSEIASRLEGFKCKISYADPIKRDRRYLQYPDGMALARNSDVLFLAAAGGPKGSPPLVGADILEALGPSGIFINVARGWLVDERALVSALENRRLGAAGLDVFCDEPKVPAELFALDNVVLTPHIASATEETFGAMRQCVLDNLESWFAGRGALTPVT